MINRPAAIGRAIPLFLCILVSGLLTSPVYAQDLADLERAKALFKKAETHFKLGEFKQALPLYKEAYRVKPLAGFLFNLGQCHRYLGNCDQANFFFRQFITAKPNSPHVVKVKSLMESCKPATAPAATKPTPVPAATKPTPVPTAKPAPAPAAKPAPEKKPEPGPEGDSSTEVSSEDGTRRALLWGGMGLTAAMLVTGAITGGMAYDKSEMFKDPTTPYEDLEDLESSGKALRGAAIATLSLAGVAAVGTALVYFLYPESPEAPVVSLAPLPSGGAFTLGGRF
jgi:tetratricopeptide (TPR) repeat protein